MRILRITIMNAFILKPEFTHRLIAAIMAVLISVAGQPLSVFAQPIETAPVVVNPGQPVNPKGPVERAAESVLTKRPFALPKVPSDDLIVQCRAFQEPLVPTNASPVLGENEALSSALVAFKAKKDAENVADLTSFLDKFPTSRWRPALELNLGLNRIEFGYLGDGLKHLQAAWDLSKASTDEGQQLLSQRAISELVVMQARLGLQDQLKANLKETEGRAILGSSRQRIEDAQNGLNVMQHSAKLGFKCGPAGLNTILNLVNGTRGNDRRIDTFNSTSSGTNLAQLKEWSDSLGLRLQLAKRSAGASVPIPALMHWKLSHFCAVTNEYAGRYRMEDPTFASLGNLWLSTKAIDSESDGYFLIPAGPLPAGWQSVSTAEAATVWGKGNVGSVDEGKPPCTPCSGMKDCPNPCDTDETSGLALAKADAYSAQAELKIHDTPLAFSSPGPAMNFSVNFNENEQGQPSSPQFPNLGPNWSFNWVSWITVDASKNATAHVRGGGIEVYPYTFPGNLTNPYPVDLISQASLSIASAGVFQRNLPNGSIEVFDLTDGAGTYFLTRVIDAQGNVAVVNYDGTFRITSIVDMNSNATTLTYVSNNPVNAHYYTISGITDPFGRSASFAYDSTNTFLSSITDAVGMVSRFTYNTSTSAITSLNTPYGTTTFNSYVPPGGDPAFPPKGLRFDFPDGTASTVERWLGEDKVSYFWDREALGSYPGDPGSRIYSHCVTTRWLNKAGTAVMSSVPAWVKRPLESQVNFGYDGTTQQSFTGPTNKPTYVSRVLSGNRPAILTVGGDGMAATCSQ